MLTTYWPRGAPGAFAEKVITATAAATTTKPNCQNIQGRKEVYGTNASGAFFPANMELRLGLCHYGDTRLFVVKVVQEGVSVQNKLVYTQPKIQVMYILEQVQMLAKIQ